MKNKILASILLIGLLTACVSAGRPMSWHRFDGGSNNDAGKSLAFDSQYNIILAGETYSYGSGLSDFWTVKYDSEGSILWNKSFGGVNYDFGKAVAVDSWDSVYVAGQTKSFGVGKYDVLVVRYMPDGTQYYNRTFGGLEDDKGLAIAVTSFNDVIVAGETASFGEGIEADGLIVKYSSWGSQTWNKTFGAGGDEKFTGIALDSEENIILVGSRKLPGTSNYDIWLVKTNSGGNKIWNVTVGGAGTENGGKVAIDSQDNIIVVGKTETYGAGSYDVWLLKFDSNGTQLWNRTYGTAGSEDGTGVAVDSKDDVFVTGMYSTSNGDLLVLIYESDGTLMWSDTLGGSSTDLGNDIKLDQNNNILVAGETSTYPQLIGHGTYDAWLVKYGKPLCDDGVDNDGNGIADCDEPECAGTPTCVLYSKSTTPQPTIVTLQGKLSNSTSGATIATASMYVTLRNSTGNPVWNNAFNDVLTDGVFNIPLGASEPLSLIPGELYTAVVSIDVGSATYSSAEVIFGDNSPAGDLIKFRA